MIDWRIRLIFVFGIFATIVGSLSIIGIDPLLKPPPGFSPPPNVWANSQIFTASGTWQAPSGVNLAILEAWGAGGAGGGTAATGATGGGGGGAYAKKTLSVTPLSNYSYYVGRGGTASTGNGSNGGDTFWEDGSALKAEGGKGGLANKTGGAGGLAANSVGDVAYNGGSGATGAGAVGGGGGGAAGSTGAGNAGVGGSGGVYQPLDGGLGGNMGNNVNGLIGQPYGGGGGGVYRSSSTRYGGSGSYGAIKITYSVSGTPSFRTGYYMGNGSSITISGLGFKPEFVLVKADTTAGAAAFKTSAMPASEMGFVTATAHNTTTLMTLNADGFTLGNNASINSLNVRYNYIAVAGSDCSSTGVFCVGRFVGTGSTSRSIETGFAPDFVMVKRSSAIAANFRTSLNPANEALFMINQIRNTNGGYLQSLSSTGFVVGGTNNTSAGLFDYVAIKSSSGFFASGSYPGNATDNRNITGMGFAPSAVIVKNATSGTANSTYPVLNTRFSNGDDTTLLTATANAVNVIQGLQADGFQVGTSTYSNSATDTYYWIAFTGTADPVGYGTFQMASGSYTGTGTTQTMTGIGFTPNLVFIKNDSTGFAVFRSSLMKGDITSYLGAATADFAQGITSLISGGFTVGTSPFINSSGSTYRWQAFGNGYNPETNSGAADFAIGIYTGNGIAGRTISDIRWQPNFVVAKRNGASGSVFRTSSHAYNGSGYLLGSQDSGNTIMDFHSTGFVVGNTTNVINTAATLYRWFAFKNGDNFAVGQYTGTGVNDRDMRTVGFKPSLIWIKRNTNAVAVQRPSTISGDGTQYFLNTGTAAGLIKSFVNQGVRLGTDATVNAVSGTYRYVGWRVPGSTILSMELTTDGTVDYGALGPGQSKSTLDLTDTQTASNNGNVAIDLNIKTISPAGWTIGATPATDVFVHEFSTTGGAGWTKFTDSDVYQTLITNKDASSTQNFDLRFTAPNPSTIWTEQLMTITLQAVENFP